MSKRLITAFLVACLGSPLFAQQTDVDRKIEELQRQIDILTQAIEAMKAPQAAKPLAADTQQYGLGAAASKVYRAEPGVSLGGYGEMAYANRGRSGTDTADLLSAVLYTGYKFSDRIVLNSELEVEHAS